jgi:hypothetical protein
VAIDSVSFAAKFCALRLVAQCALACGCIVSSTACQLVHAAYSRGYAVNSVNLPVNAAEATSYAIDLDGDGHAENAFGSIFPILGAMGLNVIDIPGATASATTAGKIVHLVEVRSSDVAFVNDAGAEAIWYVGKATASPPLFDGMDTFKYDGDYAPAAFFAPLSGGGFVSESPATMTPTIGIVVEIAIGNHVVALPLEEGRLEFTAIGSTLAQGQVNGAVLTDDIHNKVIPTLATAFNDIVQADPQSATAQGLLSTFDKNPTDGFISLTEVENNSFISSVFAPDVQIRDKYGNYALAVSFGFGFSAVESIVELPPIFADGFEK